MSKPDSMSSFSGALSLNNPLGTVYRQHTQTGALTLAAANNAVPNGWAVVAIVANGGAINIPSDWVKYGGDDIDTTAGVTNHFMLTWSGDFYYWTNKVTTP